MNTGMLWFDDSKTTLSVKIKRAVGYYRKKYGSEPNLVMVHPSVLEKESVSIEGVSVEGFRPVLPGHIWLGKMDLTNK